ncbi:hypothetical protein RRG08_013626 [Elysia crispata]|uniref:Lipase domain-containing protein n=1 Tax=Elysia crispata TaxID=231223 RepID=A0AAE0Y3W6_9GAST|nr:hypothetical protein RRG08_013626 [Elysia crispata]
MIAVEGYGSLRRQGHVDFYPNGGHQQPGCGSTSLSSAILQGICTASEEGIGCSHHRAIELFIRSIETDPMTTAPTATPDNIITTTSHSNNLTSTKTNSSECALWGNPKCCVPMGFPAASVPGVSGETSAEYPFCGESLWSSAADLENKHVSSGYYCRLFKVRKLKTNIGILPWTSQVSKCTGSDVSVSLTTQTEQDTAVYMFYTPPL